MKRFFSFPNPVDEVSARLVAGGVVAMVVLVLLTRQLWLLVPLVYGFWARVLTGPRLSPLGRFVTGYLRPRLTGIAPRHVPGPPKRFAQGIGAACTTGAAVAAVAGSPGVALVLVALIGVAASLEAFAGYCCGCAIFGVLQRVGVIPRSVCEACADVVRSRPVVTPETVAAGSAR